MNALAESLFSHRDQRIPELYALAGPLLKSCAVQRLNRVTFLGILSSRFRGVIDSPLWPRTVPGSGDDGSRYHHTLGVAVLALDIARHLDFSDQGQRYAVAWALTHDIATWPLSHTSEPVFSTLTGISAHKLRSGILLNNPEAPPSLWLGTILRDLDIDPSALVSLFEKFSTPADEDLALFKQIIRSPLTPDTLEGIWRCGLVFDVPVIRPDEIISGFLRPDGRACFDRRRMPAVIDFWRCKSTIYDRFINREDVVLWESAWSAAIERCCGDISLAESLELNEDELVAAVKQGGLPTVSRIIRYKEPQEYIINGALDALPPELPVSELWKVLRREPVGTSHE